MAKILDLFIDGEILPEAYIWEGETATSLYRIRKQVEAGGEFDRIRLNIFSPGGYCLEGWAIVDYLLSLGVTIDTLCYGQCASFGTIFHTMGEVREISQHCDYVVHRPWDWFVGNDLQNAEFQKMLSSETTKLFDHYAVPTGKTVDELSALIGKDDVRLSPQETVDHGFSTAIYSPGSAASVRLSKLPIKKPVYLLSLNDRKVNPNAPKDAITSVPVKPKVTMSKVKQTLQDAAKALNAFLGLDGNSEGAKALDVPLKDGSKIVTDSSGDAPAVDDNVTLEDGTVAPDGDYERDNGDVITVTGGKITAIKVAETSDNTTDSAAVATLTKENNTLKAKIATQDQTIANQGNQIKALGDKYDQLVELVKPVLNDIISPDPQTQSNRQPKGNGNAELSDREQMLAAHVEKYKRK